MSRVSAASRLRRLLAMLPWVLSQPGGASVDEVCRRFGLTRTQLMAELNLLWMVGVYPWTAAELIEWQIDDDDRLSFMLADWFARPLRLTPDQALALIVTARGLEAVPGTDPGGALARGVAKIAAVLGVDPEAVEIDFGDAEEATMELLREASTDRRQVEIRYYTYGRDRHTRRVIDPWRVFSDGGEWYVEGYCHDNDARRLFRVDRIESAVLLEASFEPPPDAQVEASFTPRPDAPRVVLDLAPSVHWVAQEYPIDRAESLGNGHLRVTMAITARPWFERLLLRLGRDAVVVEAPQDLVAAGCDAAGRVLARYTDQ
jgi:proteasome accessory factor C